MKRKTYTAGELVSYFSPSEAPANIESFSTVAKTTSFSPIPVNEKIPPDFYFTPPSRQSSMNMDHSHPRFAPHHEALEQHGRQESIEQTHPRIADQTAENSIQNRQASQNPQTDFRGYPQPFVTFSQPHIPYNYMPQQTYQQPMFQYQAFQPGYSMPGQYYNTANGMQQMQQMPQQMGGSNLQRFRSDPMVSAMRNEERFQSVINPGAVDNSQFGYRRTQDDYGMMNDEMTMESDGYPYMSGGQNEMFQPKQISRMNMQQMNQQIQMQQTQFIPQHQKAMNMDPNMMSMDNNGFGNGFNAFDNGDQQFPSIIQNENMNQKLMHSGFNTIRASSHDPAMFMGNNMDASPQYDSHNYGGMMDEQYGFPGIINNDQGFSMANSMDQQPYDQSFSQQSNTQQMFSNQQPQQMHQMNSFPNSNVSSSFDSGFPSIIETNEMNTFTNNAPTFEPARISSLPVTSNFNQIQEERDLIPHKPPQSVDFTPNGTPKPFEFEPHPVQPHNNLEVQTNQQHIDERSFHAPTFAPRRIQTFPNTQNTIANTNNIVPEKMEVGFHPAHIDEANIEQPQEPQEQPELNEEEKQNNENTNIPQEQNQINDQVKTKYQNIPGPQFNPEPISKSFYYSQTPTPNMKFAIRPRKDTFINRRYW